MTFHSKASLRARHPIHDMTFTDAVDRAAGTGYTITADDIGKTAVQTDNNSYWVLMSIGPLVWDVQGPANATTVERGLMSAADKTALDSFSAGDTFQPVSNNLGVAIPKGTLLYPASWDATNDCPYVGIADNTNASKRPAIAVAQVEIAIGATAFSALKVGTLHDFDTSAWALSDQLVLNSTGGFSRPPLDVGGITTGEVQLVGSVIRVGGAGVGYIAVNLGGMELITADGVAALQGTSGTPADGNRFVTNADSRMTDARTPLSHTHGNISNGGLVGSTANLPIKTGAAGIVEAGAWGTPVNVTRAANAAGTASTFARSDHKHDVTTAAPSTVGTANAEGTATSIARSDHVHSHGNQAGGSLHSSVSNSAAGFAPSVGANKTVLQSNGTSSSWVSPGSLKPTLSKTITVESPGAAEDIIMFRTNVAITIVGMRGILKATGSVTVRIGHDTTYTTTPANFVGNATAVTGTTEAILDISGVVAVPAGSWVRFRTTAAGTPQTVSVDIRYTED